MTPHFLFVLSTGDIWVGIDPNVVPAGTVSGNSGSYACSGGLTTSKHDASKEIK
jgi:hypothetical protein